jgi:hypothetical protein
MSYSAPASLNKKSIHSFIAFVGAACTALRYVDCTIDDQIALTQLVSNAITKPLSIDIG